MKTFSFMLATCAVLLSSPSFATDISKPGACTYAVEFEGPGSTTLFFGQTQQQFDDGDKIRVMVKNDLWSIKEDQPLDSIKFDNDGAWFSGPMGAVEHGFVMETNYKFFQPVFDGAGAIDIYWKGKKIDALSLAALFSDVLSFSSCHAKRVAEKSERDRKAEIDRRWNKDPFASKPSPATPKP